MNDRVADPVSDRAIAGPRYLALWLVLLAAGGTFALTMGVRQTMGLFLGSLNTSTGVGLANISLAFAFGYGLVNAAAVAGGAWFGPVGWPRTPAWWVKKRLQP